MIQTNVLLSQRIGANFDIALKITLLLLFQNPKGQNFDIDPKAITSPSGIAARSVTAKIMQFCPNPSVKERKATSKVDIELNLPFSL